MDSRVSLPPFAVGGRHDHLQREVEIAVQQLAKAAACDSRAPHHLRVVVEGPHPGVEQRHAVDAVRASRASGRPIGPRSRGPPAGNAIEPQAIDGLREARGKSLRPVVEASAGRAGQAEPLSTIDGEVSAAGPRQPADSRCRYSNDQVGVPCTSSTGSPAPSST